MENLADNYCKRRTSQYRDRHFKWVLVHKPYAVTSAQALLPLSVLLLSALARALHII